jgi:hypothetical protein
MVITFDLELIGDDFFDWRNRQRDDFYWWLRYMRKLGSDRAPSEVREHKSKQKLPCIRDYAKANHNGSRGIIAHYFLSTGVYDVSQRYKFNRVRHYIILVENGKYREITEQEASQWLKKNISV